MLAAVDDVNDVVDGDGRLGNVGRDNDLNEIHKHTHTGMPFDASDSWQRQRVVGVSALSILTHRNGRCFVSVIVVGVVESSATLVAIAIRFLVINFAKKQNSLTSKHSESFPRLATLR